MQHSSAAAQGPQAVRTHLQIAILLILAPWQTTTNRVLCVQVQEMKKGKADLASQVQQQQQALQQAEQQAELLSSEKVSML